jgi:hypothetical protein
VQGFEAEVIAGGCAVLARAVGCILEINLLSLYHGQPSFAELLSCMNALGFVYGGNLSQSYDEVGRVSFIDAVFMKPECLGRERV